MEKEQNKITDFMNCSSKNPPAEEKGTNKQNGHKIKGNAKIKVESKENKVVPFLNEKESLPEKGEIKNRKEFGINKNSKLSESYISDKPIPNELKEEIKKAEINKNKSKNEKVKEEKTLKPEEKNLTQYMEMNQKELSSLVEQQKKDKQNQNETKSSCSLTIN